MAAVVAKPNYSSTSSIVGSEKQEAWREFSGTEGAYMLPHHAKEIERLQKQHLFMLSTTGGKQLADIVLGDNDKLKVLDAGCADGAWLRSLSRSIPGRDLRLLGVDIGSTLFPPRDTEGQADQIELRTHDITIPFPESWNWQNSFDVVHQRLLIWGIKSNQWQTVVNNYFNLLKPGGFIQLVEAEWIDSSNPAGDDRPQLRRQARLQEWSTASFGMDINVAYHLEDYLRQAGFQNVHKIQFNHGYGAKARDPSQSDVSAELWVECFRTLDAKIPVGGIPGVARDVQDFHQFLDDLEVEIKHYGYEPKLNFVVGQKT